MIKLNGKGVFHFIETDIIIPKLRLYKLAGIFLQSLIPL